MIADILTEIIELINAETRNLSREEQCDFWHMM